MEPKQYLSYEHYAATATSTSTGSSTTSTANDIVCTTSVTPVASSPSLHNVTPAEPHPNLFMTETISKAIRVKSKASEAFQRLTSVSRRQRCGMEWFWQRVKNACKTRKDWRTFGLFGEGLPRKNLPSKTYF